MARLCGRWLAAAVVWSAMCGASFAEEMEAESRIDAVTLYRDQALVTRIVRAEVPAGTSALVVGDLPEQIVPDSPYAEAGERVRIRAVRYRTRAVGEAPQEEVRALEQQIAALEKAQRENLSEQDLVKKKQSYLDRLEVFSAGTARTDMEKGALNADELQKLTLFVFEQQAKLAQEVLERQEEGLEIGEQLSVVERQLASLTPQVSRTAREAVVFIETEEPGQAEIRLSYLVRQVEWTPAYNVRGASGKAQVELEYNAGIQQMSGEDWTEVSLTLSTATPTLASDAPGLTPFWVSLEQGGPQKTAREILELERQRWRAEQEFRVAQSDEMRRQAEAMANAVGREVILEQIQGAVVSEGVLPETAGEDGTDALAVTYPMPGRHSLKSRSDRQTVAIARLSLPAELYRIAMPALTKYVYREAKIVNDSEKVLLRGKANAYLDDEFAGTGVVPVARPGQSFTAGLGVDTRLVAEQRLSERQARTMGANRELTLTYELLLQNFSDEAIPLRLFDRIPVARDSNVRLTLLDVGALSDDPLYKSRQKPHNVLRWDVEVPPGATEAKPFGVQYSFKLEFDRNYRLSPGKTATSLFAVLRPLEAWGVPEGWAQDQTSLATTPGEEGPDRLTLTVALGPNGKSVIGSRVEGDLSACRWIELDLDNQVGAGAKLALGLVTGEENEYSETAPAYLRPGNNPNVVFDLAAVTCKTEATNWEYRARMRGLHDVREVYFVFYPRSSGTVTIRSMALVR